MNRRGVTAADRSIEDRLATDRLTADRFIEDGFGAKGIIGGENSE